jgi:hypothetical protein
MFLCAVARPRWDYHKQQYFDGKLGIFPFVEKVPAKRSSKNRPKGTLVTTPVSVTGSTYQEWMIEKVLPAIKSKWPKSTDFIRVQDDGARPHTKKGVRESIEAAARDMGLPHLKMEQQPPQSPQFNALDCGVFNSIQKKVYEAGATGVDGLIAAVEEEFLELPPYKIDNTFLSVQCAMEDCLKVDGDNTMKLRHMSKGKLRKEGLLPTSIKVDPLLIAKGREILDNENWIKEEKERLAAMRAAGVGVEEAEEEADSDGEDDGVVVTNIGDI